VNWDQGFALASQLKNSVQRVIIGKDSVIEQCLVCFLAGGHLLIEDVPGTGKTTLAKALALSTQLTFRRIQLTPDLLPSDITGAYIYNQKTSDFDFKKGPIFTHILLADEINRATPRTQSSLLEAMEEHQVTVEGITTPLEEPFFVIATQNPVEYQGVYKLPEAQLDRFMMRISLGYLPPEKEVQMLLDQMLQHPITTITPVVGREEILELQRAIRHVKVSGPILEYIVALGDATRRHGDFLLGASPRGALGLLRTSQALAFLRGREYVIPDDVKELFVPLLSHRVYLKPHLKVSGLTEKEVLTALLHEVPIS